MESKVGLTRSVRPTFGALARHLHLSSFVGSTAATLTTSVAVYLPNKERQMLRNGIKRVGGMRWGLAALLLGLPLPIVLIAFLFGGCHN
jgi:hypothetical protein